MRLLSLLEMEMMRIQRTQTIQRTQIHQRIQIQQKTQINLKIQKNLQRRTRKILTPYQKDALF